MISFKFKYSFCYFLSYYPGTENFLRPIAGLVLSPFPKMRPLDLRRTGLIKYETTPGLTLTNNRKMSIISIFVELTIHILITIGLMTLGLGGKELEEGRRRLWFRTGPEP